MYLFINFVYYIKFKAFSSFFLDLLEKWYWDEGNLSVTFFFLENLKFMLEGKYFQDDDEVLIDVTLILLSILRIRSRIRWTKKCKMAFVDWEIYSLNTYCFLIKMFILLFHLSVSDFSLDDIYINVYIWQNLRKPFIKLNWISLIRVWAITSQSMINLVGNSVRIIEWTKGMPLISWIRTIIKKNRKNPHVFKYQ